MNTYHPNPAAAWWLSRQLHLKPDLSKTHAIASQVESGAWDSLPIQTRQRLQKMQMNKLLEVVATAREAQGKA